MRDLLLLVFILAALGVTLRYPFVGVLTWAWFSLMTPHQMAYGVFGLPLNLLIAAATAAAIIFNGGFKRGGWDAITVLLIIFSGWLSISQVFSLDADNSAEYTDRFLKTMLFVIICAQMAADKLRIHALIWLIVIGLGYFAAKGALFTVVTLGEHRVQGIPTTILEDNNHMGIALSSLLPLILYLRGQALHKWVRMGLLVLFGMTIVSIIGTHSRGAFLSLIAFGGFYWLQSKHKVSILAALFLVTLPAIAFMPAKWGERMASIGEATQDASFMGRVDAWVINYKLANANPVTGAGLRNSYEEDIAREVDAKRADSAKAAHSIYFEILGGAGYIGLLIYVIVLTTAFFTARHVAHHAKKIGAPEWRWQAAHALQVSLAVFCVGGASVSLEMWDGYWMVIALIAGIARLHAREGAEGGPVDPRQKFIRRSWRAGARGRSAEVAPTRP